MSPTHQKCVGTTLQARRCRRSSPEKFETWAEGMQLLSHDTTLPMDELEVLFGDAASRFLCRSHKPQAERAKKFCWQRFSELVRPTAHERFANPTEGTIGAYITHLEQCYDTEKVDDISPPSGDAEWRVRLISDVRASIEQETKDDQTRCIGIAHSKNAAAGIRSPERTRLSSRNSSPNYLLTRTNRSFVAS